MKKIDQAYAKHNPITLFAVRTLMTSPDIACFYDTSTWKQ